MFHTKSHDIKSIITNVAQRDYDIIAMSYRENMSDTYKPEVPLSGVN